MESLDPTLVACQLSSQIWVMSGKAREGDLLLYARGGDRPLILRPQRPVYELVGVADLVSSEKEDDVSRGRLFRSLCSDIVAFNEKNSGEFLQTYQLVNTRTSGCRLD